jgi:hypothetical protein
MYHGFSQSLLELSSLILNSIDWALKAFKLVAFWDLIDWFLVLKVTEREVVATINDFGDFVWN